MYITIEDIVPAKITEDQLQQIALDGEEEDQEEKDSKILAVVTGAIEDADSEINSYCATRYQVPFDPVPRQVRNMSVKIAVYNLFNRRSMTFAGEIPKSYRDDYKDTILFLKDVSRTQAKIEGAVKPPQHKTNVGGSFKASPKVFDNKSMRGL